MNDFDQFLELKLRQMLDPVVATKAPGRGSRRRRARRPTLTVEVPVVELVEVIPVPVEHAVVPVPVATPQL
ncbi:MAG TPA: hypothetical protein VFK22_01085 [Candidatus Dormibacteraeota bacterium]|nr:hypothetical protein [Candidatus Dormibacteraeota bacterium]